MERRFITRQLSNLRSEKKGDDIRLTFHAALFNTISTPIGGKGGFREKINPGAFRRSLERGPDVGCYVEHNPEKVLGRRSAGTLHVEEDKRGLYAECLLPDTSYARDLVVSINRGDIRGASFGFENAEDDWEDDGEGEVRTILNTDVFDVSVVMDPAYAEANDVAIRSRQLWVSNRNRLYAAKLKLKMAGG